MFIFRKRFGSILATAVLAPILSGCSLLRGAPRPPEFEQVRNEASEDQIKIRGEAMKWADDHVQGLLKVPIERRIAVYYVTTLFYNRLFHWRDYKPFYDKLYAESQLARKYVYFIKPDDGLFLVILQPGEKVTDLAPYRALRGKPLVEIYGPDYAGSLARHTIDDSDAESARETLIFREKGLTAKPKGTYNAYYHEFGHLLHLSLMTQGEYEKLDRLYSLAKQKNLFLDDYAAKNASEYFAVGLEAFISETKDGDWKYNIHTREELSRKDPDLASFIAKILYAPGTIKPEPAPTPGALEN